MQNLIVLSNSFLVPINEDTVDDILESAPKGWTKEGLESMDSGIEKYLQRIDGMVKRK